MHDIAKIDVISWIDVKIWHHFITLTIFDGEQFWHWVWRWRIRRRSFGLRKWGRCCFFRGPWFSVVEPDTCTFHLPEPDFRENAGPVNFDPGMSTMGFLVKFLHANDDNDIIDILVRETNRYADQKIAPKSRPPRILGPILVFATGFRWNLTKCLLLLAYCWALWKSRRLSYTGNLTPVRGLLKRPTLVRLCQGIDSRPFCSFCIAVTT